MKAATTSSSNSSPETKAQQKSEAIRAAYEKLAEGVSAVLALKDADTYIHNMLVDLSNDIWTHSISGDQAGTARWQLQHVARFKEQQAGGAK